MLRSVTTATVLSTTWFLVAVFPLSAAETKPLPAFLQTHCVECHSGSHAENGLSLDTLSRSLASAETLAKWVQVYDRIDRREMPPKDQAQPTDAERTAFLSPLRDSLTRAAQARAQTVLRRLNRAEYERTINDLLGTTVSVAEMLPEDGRAFGFDNIGESLDLSPVQLQRYMEAAGKVLDAALSRDVKPECKLATYTFDSGRNTQFIGKHWLKREDGATVFFAEGGYPAISVNEFRVAADGRYRFRLHTAAYQSQRPMVYGVYLGSGSQSKPPSLFRHFAAAPGDIAVQEFESMMLKGHTLRIMLRGLTNNFNPGKEPVESYKGSGLAILKMEVEGPFIDEWPSRGQLLRFGDLAIEDVGDVRQRKERWYKPKFEVRSSQPEADVARLLLPFASAAFRRPATADEVQPFIELAQAELASGAKIEQALRTAQVALLSSPEFLYLIEPPGRLSDYAVASRLSYMLWGTTPDAQLLALAASGTLTQPQTLRAQTERLLADARAQRFTENFVGQWLNLREIESTTPDRQLYPEFDEQLKESIVQETHLFFDEVLRQNLSLLNFVDSDWTFLNERLAKHYGVAGVEGIDMRRVALQPADGRGGVLTHASVLKVSANGTTTSPVTRGAWVLQRIVGFDPPPPPPGIPGVEPDIRGAETLRDMLAKHRSNESCNNCHKTLDPPGFALESYDVVGGLRENYRSLGKQFSSPKREQSGGRSVQWRIGPPVDPSGVTADGQSFANLAEYKKLLLANPQPIARALATKLAIYGSGRGIEFSDRPEIDRIVSVVSAKKYGFRDLVHEVIQSKLFLSK